MPRRTAPGGLQRHRHPTSPAILHRACASKAAYTPPPTLSLSPFLSLLLPLISSRTVVSLADPRFAPLVVYSPLAAAPFAHTSRGTHFDLSNPRFAALSWPLPRREKRFDPSFSAAAAAAAVTLRFNLLRLPATLSPLRVIAFPFVFLSPCRMFARSRSPRFHPLFIYPVAPTLRGFVSVISTMETRGELELEKCSISAARACATVVN